MYIGQYLSHQKIKALNLVKLLLTCTILYSGTLFAQLVEDDFEGNGNINSWYGDDCGMDNNFSNPLTQGLNTSAKVLKYTDTGGTYANVQFDIQGNFSMASQAVFSLKLYVPSSGITGNQNNQVSLKLQDGNLPAAWSTQCEIIKPIVLDQWQEITFDFANDPYINLDAGSPAPTGRTDFNRVVIQVNGENNNDQVVAYLDDFLYNGPTGSGGGGVFNQLVWADEFDGTGMIDTSKWFQQTLLPLGNSWYNGEVQHYTDRLDNARLDSGYLHIIAKKETYTDQGHTKQYTSARLNSKFAFTYGRVEVRAKMPQGLGTWPAIWTLGKNINEPGAYWTSMYGTVGWPACGEIDIIEHWGHNPNVVQSALHTPSSSGATVNKASLNMADVFNTFHIYEMEWTEDEIRFSVDGNNFYTYAPSPKDPQNWPFTADQFILLNVAMQANVDPNFVESPMIIDYVRVYEEGPATSNVRPVESKFQILPNPFKDSFQVKVPEQMLGGELKVYSLKGDLLFKSPVQDREMTLSIDGLTEGVYLISIQGKFGEWTEKLVKTQ